MDKTNGTSEKREVFTSLMQQYLSSEHSALQKVVSDLFSRTDKLQAQELQLNSQMRNTLKALEAHPDLFRSQNSDQKSNSIDFGMEESPAKCAFAERHKYCS